MDPRRVMIIDTSRLGSSKMFITSQVDRLEIGDGMWRIAFKTKPTVYIYRYERIKYLKDPKVVELKNRGFYLKGKRIENIQCLLEFEDMGRHYYHAVYDSGKEVDYTESEVYVSRTNLDECGGGVWKYLQHLATEIGLEVENYGNIMQKQYAVIDRKRDMVPLAQYLGDKSDLKSRKAPKQIIFPFGCNASQKKAVEYALTNQVSIIQGPPGTGKTQTILNIISNLLIMGKSVLVVSNNNSAVDNVAEKLSSESIGLGFLVSKLGSAENKARFIENQPPIPDMTGWILLGQWDVLKIIRELLDNVSRGFDSQEALAKLRIELETLKTEHQYNDEISSDDKYSELLSSKPSKKLINLKCICDRYAEGEQKLPLSLLFKQIFSLGLKSWAFLHEPLVRVSADLEHNYYVARLREIKQEIAHHEDFLKSIDLKENVKNLRDLSLAYLKHTIAQRGGARRTYSIKDIKPNTESFLKDYPVVLSTTYASKTCISPDYVFDYVIMDEASQVDIMTGALALSCAENAVIVGDDKQLPNVTDHQMEMALTAIQDQYHVEDKYCSTSHSFLQSCCDVFIGAPQTLLREHYRCHPKIIDFCNKRFYDGQLLIMTEDKGEKDVLKVIRTAPGNHARGHFNQREIDVILKEVMPTVNAETSVGIITPYRNQAEEINRQLGQEIASTVHKYQGRECDTIIMSMVDNEATEFSDDSNLLNVAISRAKSKLCIVATGNELDKDSNLAQLIEYATYNNFEVTNSQIRSVFDFLYKQYTQERLAFEKTTNVDLGELSENIIYLTLNEAISKLENANIEVVSHYPLKRLIADDRLLTEEEKVFTSSELTHVDFLLYNSITKKPILTIEVDGWAFHQSDVQKKRDAMKDDILSKYRLKPLRISTFQAITVDSLSEMIKHDVNVVNENGYCGPLALRRAKEK